jgi:hypothetical protein
MHIEIHSWVDGYLALRTHAVVTRGAIELDTGARWPRTTGADVVTIAALFDPSIRDHGSAGLRHRWQVALDEIKHEALTTPTTTYAENRSLWSTLEIAAIALDDAAAPLPSASTWRALLAEIGAHHGHALATRNVGPTGPVPFGPFQSVKTYDDVYIAEYKLLRDQRGADTVAPPAGFGGTAKPIPRTTNADVLQLATYWGGQLQAARRVFGTDTITAQWRTAAADVDHFAKPGKPTDVYPKNNEFWRTLVEVAIHVAVADEAPTSADLANEAIKDSIKQLPQRLEQVASKTVDVVRDDVLGILKKPLYLGVGLVGLYLLTRNRRSEAA